MWTLDVENRHRKSQSVLFYLVFLSVVLSACILIMSIILSNQMQKLHDLVPLMNINQRINTQVIGLKYEVVRYSSLWDSEAASNARKYLIAISELSSDFVSRVKSFRKREDMYNVIVTVDRLLNDTKNKSANEVIAAIKKDLNSIDKNLSAATSPENIQMTLIDTETWTNRVLYISSIIFVVIGGGMLFGFFFYMVIVNNRLKKADNMVNLLMIDEVTGLYTKNYFESRILEAINRVQRFSKPFGLLLLKINFPGSFNSNEKAAILKEAGARLLNNTRIYDVNSRYFENIFASIIHEIDSKEMQKIITRIKKALEQKEIVFPDSSQSKGLFFGLFGRKEKVKNAFVRVKATIGCLICESGVTNITELIRTSENVLRDADLDKKTDQNRGLKRSEKRWAQK